MLAHSLASQPQPVSTPRTALVSSGDMTWDHRGSYSADTLDVVSWNYYALPPSPPASVCSNTDDSPYIGRKSIRPSFTPEPQSENDRQSCLPTDQVFDIDSMEAPSSSDSASPPPSILRQSTLSSDSGPPPKKVFTTIGGVKKGRGNGERITTKDFVPPDVTGLSKREARLLKNRAAAFLSRQRKREEFEAMEIRLKELEEENLDLQALAAKGKKYDDLVATVEQLRLRLSIAEKREHELTAELANQTATNLAVKTESHDLLSPYLPYETPGSAPNIPMMKQCLLSSLPSLLSLPPQSSLPINFRVPLTCASTARPSPASLGDQATPYDMNDQCRPRFGYGSIEFHPSSADVESSKKVDFGGGVPEVFQFDMDGLHSVGSLVVSFDASVTEDGRGSVHVQVSEQPAKPTVNESRQRPPSLTSQWSEDDPSFGMTCYALPPLSAPVSIPSSGAMDHLGVFACTGNAHSRMGFDTQLMPSGYTPFVQDGPEQAYAYYPGMIPE